MRWHCPSLLLLLLFSLLAGRSWGRRPAFKICAFNAQNFNSSKADNFRVMSVMTRMISRCDICLLQEVKDPAGSAIKRLLAALNRYDESYQYQQVSSGPLGTSAKDMQQYIFLYRKQTVKVLDQHQYKKKNSFIREPFVVHFRSNRTAIRDFVLVPLHTDPPRAVQEIDRLYDVFQEVSRKWNNKNVMFLGDFNAGCAHMTRSHKKQIRLFKQPGFYWMIGDKVDTTVGDITNCPYDRIVVHGQFFLKNIKPYSATVFNFVKTYKLSKERALKVSDHLMVEVELRGSAHLAKATPLLILLSLSVILWSCLPAL